MVKPDVLVVNPVCMDSPLWRKVIRDNRDKFSKVISVSYNDHRSLEFLDFYKSVTKDFTHVDIGEITFRDWRDQCVNAGIKEVTSDWILFMEQDFLPGEGFWEGVLDEAEDYDVVGYGDMGKWSEDVRLHPSFLLVRTAIVKSTRMDFGAYPDFNRDHFAVFTEELFKMKNLRFLDISKYNWEHLKGLYSNYMLVLAGGKPNYEVARFKQYVIDAMNADVVHDERFLDWSRKCLED